MNYQEFAGAVEKKMNYKMEGGMRANLYRTLRNNGTERLGIMMETEGRNMSPTIYLEEFYMRYQKGETLDDIVKDIERFCQEARAQMPEGVGMLERFERVHDKIVFKLINTGQNQELLRDVPNMPFLDLSIVFYVLLGINSKGTATMLVRNEHLKLWDVKVEDMIRAAEQNVTRLLPAELTTMRRTMDELLCPSECGGRRNLLYCGTNGLKSGREGEEDFMYVLSNQLRSFGAACIVYPHVLEMVGNIVGEDFSVLPSSVHEVIIVPESYSLEQKEMDEMVTEINETQVADEEVLSNHAYFYEREAKKLILQKYVSC
ncbi:MAG: hypothetical protein HFH23_09145 [Ruminococcus sp.]|nr:hypothetical protein [Ruminococcus sp.]